MLSNFDERRTTRQNAAKRGDEGDFLWGVSWYVRRNEVDSLELQPQCFQYVPDFSTLVNRDRLVSRHTSTLYITRESSSFKKTLNEMTHSLFMINMENKL